MQMPHINPKLLATAGHLIVFAGIAIVLLFVVVYLIAQIVSVLVDHYRNRSLVRKVTLVSDDEVYKKDLQPDPANTSEYRSVQQTINTTKKIYGAFNAALQKKDPNHPDIMDQRMLSSRYDDY